MAVWLQFQPPHPSVPQTNLCQSCHALILLLIISTPSTSSCHDQTQINRYHCPSNATIKLSLRLNLKCLSCRSTVGKYAHVWLRGRGGRQELGRNAHFLDETAPQGGVGCFYQSCVSTGTLSDARRHTSEMNNKAGRWGRGRSQEVDDFTCSGVRSAMDRYAGVNILQKGNGSTLWWPPLSTGLSSGWLWNS